MKKYLYIWFISLFILSCQSGENKYPSKSLRVLGWTSDDQHLVLGYSNLKNDLPEGKPSPIPSEVQHFLYTYEIKNGALKQEVNLSSKHLHDNEKINGMGYQAQMHSVYYESEDWQNKSARFHVYDLKEKQDQVVLTTEHAITNFRNIEVSLDGRYAYTYDSDQYVYDLELGKAVKWQMPLKTSFLSWFETEGRSRFASQQGIFELASDPSILKKVHDFDLQQQGISDYRFLRTIDEQLFLYAIFRRENLPALVTLRSSELWEAEEPIKHIKPLNVSPEHLSHDRTRFAYVDNQQLIILNLADMSKRPALSIDQFPDGGLITAPFHPVDSVFK